MASYNRVVLAGHLTRDIELRYTPKGAAVGKVGLAVNRTWTTESGEKKEEVAFIDLTFWGRNAENVSQYTRKGSPLLVEGRIQQENWDDKQTGQKRSKLSVVVESFQFLGSKPEGEEPARRQAPEAQSGRQRIAAQSHEDDSPPPDDDVPF